MNQMVCDHAGLSKGQAAPAKTRDAAESRRAANHRDSSYPGRYCSLTAY